ncbi:ComEC/Rec2 family competence protein [Candidatus Dependentiae bacterium]
MARSGLHLVIFMFLWGIIFSFIPLPFTYKQLALIGLGLFYCLLSWTSISFIRAISIFLLYKISPLLHKQGQLLHLLTIICLVTLIWNPAQLLFLDFQLSFGLTLALAWFGQIKLQRKFLQNC